MCWVVLCKSARRASETKEAKLQVCWQVEMYWVVLCKSDRRASETKEAKLQVCWQVEMCWVVFCKSARRASETRGPTSSQRCVNIPFVMCILVCNILTSISHCFTFYNSIVPMRFLPWENWVAFPGDSQL